MHHADILRTDLRSLVAENASQFEASHNAPPRPPRSPFGALDVVGNLPYYITSEILLHLFAAAREGTLRRAILMVQREVAERIAALPGASEYGALSALAQLHGQVTELFTLPPNAFQPPPEVFSTVLRFDFTPRFAELGVPFETFNTFLRSTFAQKRKTLANNLRAAGYTAAQLTQAWPAALPATARAEAVPLESLAALYRSLAGTAAP